MKYKIKDQNLSFMCITSKKLTANFNLAHNLIVWPDQSTLFMASCVTDLTVEKGSFRIEAVVDCLHSVSDGMVSVQYGHKKINSYI
jgi:hypothetical protein